MKKLFLALSFLAFLSFLTACGSERPELDRRTHATETSDVTPRFDVSTAPDGQGEASEPVFTTSVDLNIMGGSTLPLASVERLSMASLYADYGNGVFQFRCSAAIIRKDLILTAAHCIVEANSGGITGVSARAFKIVLPASVTYPAGFGIAVTRALAHPSYALRNGGSFGNVTSNDVALLKLAASVPAPYQVATLAPSSGGPSTGALFNIGGFGLDKDGGAVQLLNPKTSKMNYLGVNPDKTILLANSDTGACSGDSGSPLYLIQNGQMTVYGVLSWGSPCKLGSTIKYTKIYIPNLVYNGYTSTKTQNAWLTQTMLSL